MIARASLASQACAARALALSAGALGCGPPADCVAFNASSIAAMRGSAPSCYELAHVVVVARTPSTKAPRVYLEDASGGDGSAIMAKCSSASSHSCPAATDAIVQGLLDGTSVTARGYYQRSANTGFEEFYLESLVDDGVLIARPPPVVLRIDDLSRDARVRTKWFQVATVDIPAADPLVMYDFSPPELKAAGPCPAFEGFAMIPASAGASVPAGCGSATNPPPRTPSDVRQVLIGRQFSSTFWASTDCGCWAASKQHLLDPSSSIAGPVRGVLVLEQKKGAQTANQVFEPLSRAFFPISGG